MHNDVKGHNRTGAIIRDDGSRFVIESLATALFEELLYRRPNLDLRQLELWKSTPAIGQVNDWPALSIG
ncbi:MAG: hypothetical protein OXH06_16395 [Gemmatimonadetes bacterium]|nr:hypothetical protein [Gemmatimonadota bacterium]